MGTKRKAKKKQAKSHKAAKFAVEKEVAKFVANLLECSESAEWPEILMDYYDGDYHAHVKKALDKPK